MKKTRLLRSLTRRRVRTRKALSLLPLAIVITGVLVVSARAAGPVGPAIAPSGAISARAGAPVLRTPANMDSDAKLGPAAPAAAAAAAGGAGMFINRPTIPLAEYNSMKSLSNGAKGPRSGAPADPPPPVVKGFNFPAAVQGENSVTEFPSDNHLAAGPNQVVEITNASFDVWSKPPSSVNGVALHLKSRSLNTFTGSSDFLGDSRVVYDSLFNRWVITIDDFSNLINSGRPNFFLAVSETPDATGQFLIFPIVFSGPSLFYDYPQLGIDQDSLLFTANLFSGNTPAGAAVFAFPKARIYNALPIIAAAVFVVPPADGTIAPPIVLSNDGDPRDIFVSAPVGAGQTQILKFTMTNSSRVFPTLAGPVPITVPGYSTPPPNARQTCTDGNPTLLVDTLDGRFQNASIQNGASLWQVHDVNEVLPTPLFYQFNINTNTTIQSSDFFRNATSFDFNPTIAADASNRAFVTWTVSDPVLGQDAMVFFGGRLPADALGVMNVQPTPAVISQTCLTQNFDPNFGLQRWGDYSAVSVDPSPAAPDLAWIVNQDILGTPSRNNWGSQIVRIGN